MENMEVLSVFVKNLMHSSLWVYVDSSDTLLLFPRSALSLQFSVQCFDKKRDKYSLSV